MVQHDACCKRFVKCLANEGLSEGNERMKNMKVIMVGPGVKEKGGMATVISNFQRYYAGNHQIEYVESWNSSHKLAKVFNAIWQLHKRVKKEEKTVLHFHVAQNGSFFRKSLLAMLFKKRAMLIFHMHASQFDVFFKESSAPVKWLIATVLSATDQVVVLSQEWKLFYSTIISTNILVIENAVSLIESHPYNPWSLNVITLGKIGERKGSFDTLQVAQRLPEINFLLFGDGDTSELQHLIKNRQIKNVFIGGWIDEATKLLLFADASLHLLPSYHEGLPMSVLETMAVGIPNMATSVGGIPQVIDSETGYLVAPGDLEAMVDGLKRHFNQLELRQTMSVAARQRIEKKFSIESFFDKWNMLYDELEKGDL